MASRRERLTTRMHRRLAKAESILALVLLTDVVVNWWLYPNSRWPEWLKTVAVMALVVGLFGPVLGFVSKKIDQGLAVTRTMTTNVLFLPRLLAHVPILLALFVAFYWVRLSSFPWR